MRFTRLEIRTWRAFRNVVITIPPDAPLICLVGENGTGKTTLFELIAAAANRLGLSPGVDIARGDPFGDPHHDFNVSFHVGRSLENLFNDRGSVPQVVVDNFARWDQVLTLSSVHDPTDPMRNGARVSAGSDLDDSALQQLAANVVEALRSSREVLYLSLDADRSYPPVGFDASSFAQELIRPDFDAASKQRSFTRAIAMYQEWERVTLASANRAATRLFDQFRRARETDSADPEFVDPFKPYERAVASVLPHLRPIGANQENTGLLFDSSGTELPFSRLSGGEREIAFIIGQIERFRLRSGLLLIDEPELHLNPDLVRNWIAFLKGYVQDGQIWIATHSMEAVEAAGTDNTFVLVREADTRLVTDALSLSSRPVLNTLASALGTPGFSITNLTFFFVEGERDGGEAQQFYDIYGDSRFVRFIEAGGGRDVSRKVLTLHDLAREADEQIHAGGIVDADFRSDEEVASLQALGLFVLPCHEIENYYLEPTSLGAAMALTGANGNATDVVRIASDAHAGRWILQSALYRVDYNAQISRAARQNFAQNWENVRGDKATFAAQRATELTNATFSQDGLETEIMASIQAYERVRVQTDFWQHCFGKQVLSSVATPSGYANVPSLKRAILRQWLEGHLATPQHVTELRTYIDGLVRR